MTGSPVARRGADCAILAACVLGLFAAVTLLSPTFDGHDFAIHVKWQAHFAAQLWGGDFYPRWLAGMTDGFGSPAFFIYPPLSHMVAALWHPVLPGPDLAHWRVAISAGCAVLLSAWAMYAWLGTKSRQMALPGTLVYVLAPYPVYVDAYGRTALGELWAFVWVPLSLYLLARHARTPVIAVAAAAFGMAGLLLSHAPASLILVPVFIAFAATTPGLRAPVLTAGIAAALGAMLAAVYLGPALTHWEFTRLDTMFNADFASSLLFHRDARIGCGPNHGYQVCQGFLVSVVQVAAFVVFAIAAWGARTVDGARLWRIAAAAGVLVVLLMTALGEPFWAAFPLLRKVQSPWRLLVPQTFIMALMAALASERASQTPGRDWRGPLVVIAMAAVAGSNLAFAAWTRLHVPPEAVRWPSAVATTVEVPEYRLASPDRLRQLFPPGVNVQVLAGTADAAVAGWSPRLIVLRVDAKKPARLVLRQFQYSGWRARAAGWQAATRGLSPDTPVAVLDVPAGVHDVELRLEPTWAERAGALLSIFTLAGMIALLAFARTPTMAE